MTALPAPDGVDAVLRGFRRRRLAALALPVLALLYLAYVAAAFDVMGLAQRARLDNAAVLLSDAWRHKVHVTRDTRTGGTAVAIEGDRQGRLAPADWPGWVREEAGTVTADLPGGHRVRFLPGGAVAYDHPGWGTLAVRREGGALVTDPAGPLPDWVSASATRVAITTEAGRLTVTRNRDEVFRYVAGWPMFWFVTSSPYWGHGPGEILWGPRIDPGRPNLAGAWEDFWGNPSWRHADVAWALGETLLMAVLGTFGAALASLPLAFLAARNVNPLGPVRFALRRLFDFVRGVDALIWTIALSRAFGPGPLTASLAILVTDAGTLGKLFSEAVETMDARQVEGVASTGAAPLLRWRFGALPQVVPVLASQVLYLLESNVRSATIIGAITGGGIGLLLTQAMQTQKDWEDVTYYVILILLMVFALDALSSRLRRRIIHGPPA